MVKNESSHLLVKTNRLKVFEKLMYGLGHVHNDLCAALWFSYGLIYFQIATNPNGILPGLLIFIGQVTDAAITPVVGYIVDLSSPRIYWHAFGSLMTVLSFPMVFIVCKLCGDITLWQGYYYGIMVCVFQIGWALVQISHLSILPELSDDHIDRTNLTAYRYSASMAANVLVHSVAWWFLNKSNNGGFYSQLASKDLPIFMDISLVVDLLGAFCSTIFLTYGLVCLNQSGRRYISSDAIRNGSLVKLLTSPVVYKISGIYTLSRLFLNLTMVYLPLYLHNVVEVNKQYIAAVPLAMFVTAGCTSVVFNIYINRYQISYKKIFLAGWTASFIAIVIIFLNKQNHDSLLAVFLPSSLLGVGSGLTVIISLTLAVNQVQANGTDAMVFSIVTFSDKIINGIAVFLIEYMNCAKIEDCPYYYWNIMVYFNGFLLTSSLVVIYLISLNDTISNL
ncbi:major facilitator superfamily domain-containing protein 12-like [Rhodnius prolixus]|uniref:major facilitator superfamily domain-containing protein 12-like n=1 Tax=Rhodnius prolixus TaxID=13249 RepID=UPI003D18A3A3